jgi:hypothetical protein
MIVSPIRAPIVSPIYGGIRTAFDAIAGNATQQVLELLRAAGKKAFFPSTNPSTGWWQDSTRVTQAALEQPVGWIDDLSLGLTLGADLVTNGGFDTDTWWTKTGAASITGGVGKLSGISSLDRAALVTAGKSYVITFTIVVRAGSVRAQLGGTQGVTYSASGTYTNTILAAGGTTLYLVGVAATDADVDNVTLKELPGYHATQATSLNRPTYTKKVNVFTSTTDTVSTARTGTTFAGAYTLYIGSGSLTLSGTATGTYAAGSHSITCTAGTLTATPSGTVTNLDCRLTAFSAMNLPVYQSVTSATVYDTAGFIPMLYFDGTSDALATSAIDLSGTDQLMALCNVLKVSDAAMGVVYELGSGAGGNTGVMFLVAPRAAASASYEAWNKGTAAAFANYTNASVAAPNLACLRHDSDISTPVVTLSRNGVQLATSAVSQGTGNYGAAHKLNIGSRDASGTASLWFKGYMIPGPLLDTTGIPTALLDQMAREQAALWGVAI